MRRIVVAAVAGCLVVAPSTGRAGGGGAGECPRGPAPASEPVAVRDFCFDAWTVTARTGDVVTWTVDGAAAPHDITFMDGPTSGRLTSGLRARFNAPGRYRYVCSYHGYLDEHGRVVGMGGVVVVDGTAGAGDERIDLLASAPIGAHASGNGEEVSASASPVAARVESRTMSGGRNDPLKEDRRWPASALAVTLVLGIVLGAAGVWGARAMASGGAARDRG